MSPSPQLNNRPNAQPIPSPPFQWNQLTPHQQSQLTHVLARLLAQRLTAVHSVMKKEAAHEQSPQNP